MHKLRYMWYTKFQGIGGSIKNPEDFIVEEIVEKKRFARSGNAIMPVTGPYALYVLKKRNMTTQQAIEKIKKIAKKDIGYAGLKDKHAVTTQYVTIKNPPINSINEENFSLEHAGFSKNMLHIGDLKANRFEITLHGCKTTDIDRKITAIKRGIPNYFGSQRFGIRHDNHAKGLQILKGKYAAQKDAAKFYIHAYQSWLFNEAVARYVEKKGKIIFSNVKIPGYKTATGNGKIEKTIKKLMKEDKIAPDDFMVDRLRLSCTGSERQAFIKPDIKYHIKEKTVKLFFELPPGSYATIILGELCKTHHLKTGTEIVYKDKCIY